MGKDLVENSFPLEEQRDFWNRWNTEFREDWVLDAASEIRRDRVLARVRSLAGEGGRILEIGCASGWLSALLSTLGEVTAMDLADEVIERARAKVPNVEFVAGDVMELDFPAAHYDVIVCLETFSHVPDQPAFLRRVREWLKPGGSLVMTSQNRAVMRRMSTMDQAPGQLRRWVTRGELRKMLRGVMAVDELTTIAPGGYGGILRIVNSPKLNQLVGGVVGAHRLERWKERAGMGQTLLVVARRD